MREDVGRVRKEEREKVGMDDFERKKEREGKGEGKREGKREKRGGESKDRHRQRWKEITYLQLYTLA